MPMRSTLRSGLLRIFRAAKPHTCILPTLGDGGRIPDRTVNQGDPGRLAPDHVPGFAGLRLQRGERARVSGSGSRRIYQLPSVADHLQSAVGAGAGWIAVDRPQFGSPLIGLRVGSRGVDFVAPRKGTAVGAARGNGEEESGQGGEMK